MLFSEPSLTANRVQDLVFRAEHRGLRVKGSISTTAPFIACYVTFVYWHGSYVAQNANTGCHIRWHQQMPLLRATRCLKSLRPGLSRMHTVANDPASLLAATPEHAEILCLHRSYPHMRHMPSKQGEKTVLHLCKFAKISFLCLLLVCTGACACTVARLSCRC